MSGPDGITFPGDSDHITIIGKNGSGKTQAAAWLLSGRSYTKMPWIILDFKNEELLNSLPGIQEHKIGAKLPNKPGLYITHAIPRKDDERVEKLMWDIWSQENTGLYVDEGYQIPDRSESYQALLTQGRSKRTPVITLTQRPSWISRFAFSEANFLQVFKLTDARDRKAVMEFVPLPIHKALPKYHSWWWDNKNDYKAVLRPVPDTDTIRAEFANRLHVKPSRRSF